MVCVHGFYVVKRFVRKLQIIQKKRRMESENTKYKLRDVYWNRMFVVKKASTL